MMSCLVCKMIEKCAESPKWRPRMSCFVHNPKIFCCCRSKGTRNTFNKPESENFAFISSLKTVECFCTAKLRSSTDYRCHTSFKATAPSSDDMELISVLGYKPASQNTLFMPSGVTSKMPDISPVIYLILHPDNDVKNIQYLVEWLARDQEEECVSVSAAHWNQLLLTHVNHLHIWVWSHGAHEKTKRYVSPRSLETLRTALSVSHA